MNTNEPVSVEFSTGNFDLAIKAVLKPEVVTKMLKNGFNWVVQRDGATKAYVEIAGVENDKGKKVLPADFVRDSVAWSDENGATVALAFEKALQPYCESVTVDASEHEAAEAVGSRKQATEMWAKAQANPALLTALGLASDATDEAGIEACHTFLQGLRKPKS